MATALPALVRTDRKRRREAAPEVSVGRWLATLVLLEVLANGVAWACSCIPTTAEGAVGSGDPIVLATVEDVRVSGCGSPGVRKYARIEVTEVIAGPGTLGDTIVWTSTSEASCGLDLVPGDGWVFQIMDGNVGLCSASSRVAGPQDPWVEELRAAASGGPAE